MANFFALSGCTMQSYGISRAFQSRTLNTRRRDFIAAHYARSLRCFACGLEKSVTCATCFRLLTEYDQTEKNLDLAIHRRFEALKRSSVSDYRRLKLLADQASAELGLLADRIERHQKSHSKTMAAAGES
jgi:hypothetical protein